MPRSLVAHKGPADIYSCFRHIQYFESESRMQIQRHVSQVSDKHQRRGQVIKWANAPPYTHMDGNEHTLKIVVSVSHSGVVAMMGIENR